MGRIQHGFVVEIVLSGGRGTALSRRRRDDIRDLIKESPLEEMRMGGLNDYGRPCAKQSH